MSTDKAHPWFERDGDWWVRNGDGSEHRLLDIAPTLERDALKDADHIRQRINLMAQFKNPWDTTPDPWDKWILLGLIIGFLVLATWAI